MTANNAPEDALPAKEKLSACADVIVLDKDGKESSFKAIVNGDGSKKRHMIIFIRHFFCGSCQSYISTLSQDLPPSALASDTAITVIGCGRPDLIPRYIEETACAYPIYCDPTGKLYKVLGMTSTLAGGSKQPDYMKNSVLVTTLMSIRQIVTWKGGTAINKAGSFTQVGGEFLFRKASNEDGAMGGWTVEWCHRMRNTRDHTEVPAIKKALEGSNAEIVSPSEEAKVEQLSSGRPAESGEVQVS